METPAQNSQQRSFSIKLWPPSEDTRLMLMERITKCLSSPSILSRKYRLLSKEEAEVDARKIENMAFAAADEQHKREPDGDGSYAVQHYAEESQKLMLEVIKRVPTSFHLSGGPRAFIEAEEAEKSKMIIDDELGSS